MYRWELFINLVFDDQKQRILVSIFSNFFNLIELIVKMSEKKSSLGEGKYLKMIYDDFKLIWFVFTSFYVFF